MVTPATAAAATAAAAAAAVTIAAPPVGGDDGAAAAAGGNSDARLVDANSGAAGGAVVTAVTAAALADLYGQLYAPIGFAQAIPRPPEGMLRRPNGDVAFVGGIAIGGALPPLALQEPPRRRGRGRKSTNEPRHCKMCKRQHRSNQDQLTCAGAVSNPRKGALFFCNRAAAEGAAAGGATTGGAAGATGAGAAGGGGGGGAAAAVGGS